MKNQFKSALEIQCDGSKQILAAMVTYSESTNDSLKRQIASYQKVINQLNEIVKSFGGKS